MIITILGTDYNTKDSEDLERLYDRINICQVYNAKGIAKRLLIALVKNESDADKALAIARKEQRHACADAIMNCNVHASSDWKTEAHSACMNAYTQPNIKT